MYRRSLPLDTMWFMEAMIARDTMAIALTRDT